MTEKPNEEAETAVEEKGEGTTEEIEVELPEEDAEASAPMGVVARFRVFAFGPSKSRMLVMVTMVCGFMLGQSHLPHMIVNHWIPGIMHGFADSDDRSNPDSPQMCEGAVDVCQAYPEEIACKDAKTPEGRDIDVSKCFINRGEQPTLDDDKLESIPSQCRDFGPMGLVGLRELQGGKGTVPHLISVADMPSNIAQHYQGPMQGVSVKSMLVTYLMLAKGNGGKAKEAMKDPALASLIQNLSLSSGEGLSEDEERSSAQMLAIYNAFAEFWQGQIAEHRQKIIEECEDYTKWDTIPIRCAVVNPPSLFSAPPDSTSVPL